MYSKRKLNLLLMRTKSPNGHVIETRSFSQTMMGLLFYLSGLYPPKWNREDRSLLLALVVLLLLVYSIRFKRDFHLQEKMFGHTIFVDDRFGTRALEWKSDAREWFFFCIPNKRLHYIYTSKQGRMLRESRRFFL